MLTPLGAGGMDEVYKARDKRLDQIVAIKILPPHVAHDPDVRQRFEREARSVAALNHPNICALYDVGHYSDTHFLVLEHRRRVAGRAPGRGPLPVLVSTRVEDTGQDN